MKQIIIFILLCFSAFGQETPTYNYCNHIIVDKNRFTGKVTEYSPLLMPIRFTKVGNTIYMSLKTKGATLNVSEHGVTILLEGGQKIVKPTADINVIPGNQDGYEYSAFFKLTTKDLEKLAKYPITDFRLDIYDESITNGKEYIGYLQCLLKR